MKNKQNDAVFTILLSIVITSCTANNKPFASVSEMQTSESVTTAVSTAEKIDSTTETEKSISDTEVQTVPITETEAEPVFMENAEKLDLECGKTTPEERDLDTILQEDYKSPMVVWSPDERYAAVVVAETTEGFRNPSGSIKVFDSAANTMTCMPYYDIQNYIHAEVQDTVNLYTSNLLSCEWITDDILKVNFDMKTGVFFYNQSNFGWYTYNLTEGKVTALSYEMEIPEPVENTMTDEEMKAVIDENLDILMTTENCYSEKDYIDAHPEAFKKIVELGNDALPLLLEISKLPIDYENLSDIMSCNIVKAAIYIIKPEMYDLVFSSPNGKYSIVASKAEFFALAETFQDYNNIKLIECLTENIICTSDLTGRNIAVEWSPADEYAAVYYGITGYFKEIIIANTINAEFCKLPNVNEIKQLIMEQNISNHDYDFYYKYAFLLSDWVTKEKIKIAFCFNNPNSKECITGYYIYDLYKKELIDIEVKEVSIIDIPLELLP